MKISKNQLKRIIKEEKAKLVEQYDDAPDPHQVSDETGSFQNALDDLDMDLRNAIQLAIDRGLILDDITDALSLAEEFAEMQLIITKVVKIPPKTGNNNTEEVTGECAFIDGLVSDLYNSANLKIDKMTSGQYILFYTAKFRKN